MHPKKAPGSDVKTSLFYQHYWSLVGNYVMQTVLDDLNLGLSPPNLNDTHIVLDHPKG